MEEELMILRFVNLKSLLVETQQKSLIQAIKVYKHESKMFGYPLKEQRRNH